MPSRYKRRFLTITAFILAAVFAWTVGPLLVVFAGIYDSATRRTDWATARTAMFFIAFLTCEFIGLIVAFAIWLTYMASFAKAKTWYTKANYVLQRYWGRALFGCGVQIYGMEIEFRAGEAFATPGPKLFLIRHSSTIDTLIPIVFCPDGTSHRYVMKEELLWDPCLDLLGNRLPNRFVRRGKGDTEGEVERLVSLAEHLCEDDALVIFPEGTRFTREKQQALAEKAKESDNKLLLKATETLFNTLPPLIAGAIELIKNAEVKSIVVVAHTGTEGAGTLRDLVHGGLCEARFIIDAWVIDRDEITLTDEGISGFLLEQWIRVDLVAGEK